MKLSALIGRPVPNGDPEVTGVTSDSRLVQPGDLFAAFVGGRDDGRRHIPSAIKSGAVAILGPPGLSADAPVVEDADPRRLYARLAARLAPPQPETLVGVTGTNGKTSVASFLRQLWSALGRPAASMGTLGVDTADGVVESLRHTTPEPVVLHRALGALRRRGLSHVVMEVSSHALDQRRADGCRFAACALTNVTHDHFDYHGGFEAYRAAKLRLFDTLLSPRGVAVLNADADVYTHAEAVCRARGVRLLSYGHALEAELRIGEHRLTPFGQEATLHFGGRTQAVRMDVFGAFQMANAAAALGLAIATGARFEHAAAGLDALVAPRGRMERAHVASDGASAFVDYAHTPDALANALDALRAHGFEKITALFGCGGDRDRAKRPLMAQIAAARADQVIVTDDNPRTEEAAAIRREVLRGAPDAEDIGDRADAIRTAVRRLAAGEALLVAGKGHETGQIVGDEIRPFDDLEVTLDAMRAREAVL